MTSPAPLTRRELGPLLRSVVKVLSVSDAPDYEQPWQTQGPVNAAGSGVVVSTARGPRVLTNAHVVENQVFVELRRYGLGRRYVAEVEAVGHDCDLALLAVEDSEFFEGTTPVERGGLPVLGDRVLVCGYPIGGERVSITEGVVSRIELSSYAQSQRNLLAIQIDAAINDGNSGGPVLQDGRLVGIAFQSLEEAQNIGYMIGAPVVEHFLRDVDQGHYHGFPDLGIVSQTLESRAQRRYLGLPSDVPGGVLITRVAYGGSAWGTLEPGDVLLGVDDVTIGADGSVPLREGEMIDFAYLVSQRFVGETLNVRIWRNGARLDCVLPLKPPARLVPEDQYDVKPSYYIFGGLLFVPLTRDYLKTFEDPWWRNAPKDLLTLHEHGVRSQERIEPVILQKVLADRVNQGYHDLEALLIEHCQGVPVRSLGHLVEIISHTSGEFVTFEANDGTQIVLERRAAVERQARVLRRFGVPADRSPDLPEPAVEETKQAVGA